VAAAADTLKRTPLHDRHVAAGARLVPFAGWEMPVQYGNIREEHRAVRSDVGIFDVSHMGEIETTGPHAEAFLQRILSNDVAGLAHGGAQYSVLCNDAGGVLDDLFTYRLDDRDGTPRFLTVTNAANHPRDLAWFEERSAGFDVTLRDRLHDLAMIAVQGPRARAVVQQLVTGGGELPDRFRTATLTVAGAPGTLVAGTGYTGEDGVELLVEAEHSLRVWDALTAAGATPVGLAARDTLRLEVCFHLYGNDLSEDRGPIEAGLGWCCKEETGFIGAEAVARVREQGPDEVLVPFVIDGPGIPREGNPVVGGGVVTSGTLSPSLDAGIGMAYVAPHRAAPGTPIEIDVRGKVRAATVGKKPLYRPEEPT